MSIAAFLCNVLSMVAIAEALLHLPKLAVPSGVRAVLCLAWTALLMGLMAEAIALAAERLEASAGFLVVRALLAAALTAAVITAGLFYNTNEDPDSEHPRRGLPERLREPKRDRPTGFPAQAGR